MAGFCQLCGQRISGRGKTFQHKKWPPDLSLRVCMDCFQHKPRCTVCGLPMAVSPPANVCTTCRETMRVCLACGDPITGRFYEFKGLGPYCLNCTQGRSPCDVCGAPLTDEHWRLSDSRMMCALCHTTAVYSPAEAAALYAEMRAIIAQRLGLELNIPTGLALVDRIQLREILRQQMENATIAGVQPQELDPQRTLGIYARRGMRRGIYVQTGLPRVLFLQVAAHEYAHAWQGENCPTLRDPHTHEGFAEWVAYQVMDYFGFANEQEHMRARQDIYGQGLRWTLEIEAGQGARGVIETCRRSA